MKNKELSIIITSYKKAELLELCINSIKKNIDVGLDYEIIVADSETEESTADLIKEKFKGVIFLRNEKNQGFGKLVNQGIKKSCGEYLFVINHDIIIKGSAIQELLDFIKRNKSVGIVSPKLINFDGKTQDSAFKFYSWRTILYRRTFLGKFSFAKKYLDKFLLKKEMIKGGIVDVDWVMGSAMMMSSKTVSLVGGVDDNFFMYFEDVDWCRRFWENGYKVVYNPTVTVAHYHGKASGNKGAMQAVIANKYTRTHIRSALIYFWKYRWKKNPHQT
jgi:GT2 family glycosyltransferase